MQIKIGKTAEEAKRVELLKDYIHRLNDGEDLASVQKDFVASFEHVDASEIAKAEQEIIAGGVPVEEVKKLCDVHSALFHGTTTTEQVGFQLPLAGGAPSIEEEQIEKVHQLAQIPGHPVNSYMEENEVIFSFIKDVRRAQGDQVHEELEKLVAITDHYASIGDLIYPLLNRGYGYSGPANVMWGVDNEIRDELRELNLSGSGMEDFEERLDAALTRAEEMIYKENNILFPLCAEEFSEDDWMRIYYDLFSYESCLEDGYSIWQAAEDRREDLKTIGGMTAESFDKSLLDKGGHLALGAGRMTQKEIQHLLNAIPMELTFVDENDINAYHNKGHKFFKRPDMAIGRDVWACHSPEFEVKVRTVIDLFKSGKEDVIDVWMEKRGEPALVKFVAIRDDEGNYLGTLEAVQMMGFARDHFTK